MASKVLSTTNQPEMLRALIGEDLTREFIEFCQIKIIKIEDVINDNYTEADLEMNLSKKYATIVGLSAVDKENIEIVRNFVKKLGSEILAVFDNLWIQNDEKRLEVIAELKAQDVLEGGISR